MNADSKSFAELFNQGGNIQYMVPYFQRQYAWMERDWQLLLDDVLVLCGEKDSDDATEHFMGSIVVVAAGFAGSAPRFMLIDGQQRLITVSLLLKSLYTEGQERLADKAAHIPPFLVNALEKNTDVLKVLPSEKKHDREAYHALVGGVGTLGTGSRIREAYDFFVRKLKGLKDDPQIDLQRLYDVITAHLMFIRIVTVQGDKPYRIFESLNARGEPLSQGDLIRNYVAMRLPDPDDQDEVFRGNWGTIDQLFDDSLDKGKSGMGELTAFVRHFLATISSVLYDERSVYQEFRNHAERETHDTASFKLLIEHLSRYAAYYDRLLRPQHEPDAEISKCLESLELFDQSASYPFLLEAYAAMNRHILTREQFADMVRVLEDYFVRRFVCGYPTNYANKQLPQVWSEVSGRDDSVQALRLALGKRRCPTDKEVAEEVVHMRLYQTTKATPRISHILLQVSHKVAVNIDAHPVVSPTIEHIMPQTLSAEWRADLGPEADEVNSRYGDTLANLTLVPQTWNSQLSNRPFGEKRAKLIDSKLPLNYEYFENSVGVWRIDQLRERGAWLAKTLCSIHPGFPRSVEPPQATGESPRLLRLDGKLVPVSSWRDVTQQTLSYIVEQGMFEKARSDAPGAFRREEELPMWRPRWRKLPNGWRVDTAMSRRGTKRFCEHMLTVSGLGAIIWRPLLSGEKEDE